MKGKGLAGSIGDVKMQIADRLKILLEILKKYKNVRVQWVWYTKGTIGDRSELKELRKPPDSNFPNLTIQNVAYEDPLPDKYVTI